MPSIPRINAYDKTTLVSCAGPMTPIPAPRLPSKQLAQETFWFSNTIRLREYGNQLPLQHHLDAREGLANDLTLAPSSQVDSISGRPCGHSSGRTNKSIS